MRLDKSNADYSDCDTRNGVADALIVTSNNAFEQEGRLHCPAGCLEVSFAKFRDSGDASVQIDLIASSQLGNNLALFMRLTAEGARIVAAQLLAEAATLDSYVAQQAAAAIEAARKTGGAA